MARSMPFSPTCTSRGRHCTDSVGLATGRVIWQRSPAGATVMIGFPGRPAHIKAPHGAKSLEITWPGGRRDVLPHTVLRGYCPCAGCQGHSGTIRFQQGGNLEIRELQPVGNYALGLRWGDAHDTGIFTFEYLWRLGRWLEAEGEEALIARGTLPAELPP